MVLIGMIVSAFFMNVFSVSSDAMLHCFVLDEELSENGTATHNPPEDLAEFVNREREHDPMSKSK